MRKTISIELAPHIIEWLEFLKTDDDAISKLAGHAPSSTIEQEAALQIEAAYMQACAAGQVPAAIMNDGIPF